jgi:hypothetical protein
LVSRDATVQLDQLSVALRQRNPWEAIDLGFAMVREWWQDAYAAWLAVFVPAAVAACLLLPPIWAFLLVWWLNPAIERVVLHVVASAVFGSRPRLRDTLRSFFSYARNGLIRSLLPPFRFSPTRSFDLPVRQLENARGRIARLRSKQLHRRVINQASWLTIVCMLFEAVVFFSLVGLYDLLLPAASQDSFNPFEVFQATPSHAREYVVTALFLTAMAVIEPLYVASGFALYLNRRTALEGWDLEVQLRRIAQRTDPRQEGFVATPPAVVAAVAMVIGVAALLATPGPSAAQDAGPPPHDAQAPRTPDPADSAQTIGPAVPPRSEAKRQILEVLKEPQFQQFETQTLIEPLQKKPEPDKTQWNTGGIDSFMRLVAQILRGAVWVLVGGVLAYALYWVLRRLNWIRAPERSRWTPPQTLFGLDVRPESLPQDVAAVAAQLARAGNLVGALSLLYRGTLAALLHRDQIELVSGDTEVDCLVKTRSQLATPAYGYLSRLLSAWQAAAYAHRLPAQLEVEQLAAEWPTFFRAEPA